MKRIIFSGIVVLVLTTAVSITGNTQVYSKSKFVNFYAGIGLGLDYGGIGFRAEYLPVKQLGLFGGAGYNFDRVGVNGGVSWKIQPEKKVSPFLMAMYGYNGVIKITNSYGGSDIFRETYYGPSFGAGLELKTRNKDNKWSFALIVPVRGEDFTSAYDYFEQSGVDFKTGKSPVLISIGYNLNSANK